MAIKASNQMTLIDLTDGYSVMMSSESYTFKGSTSAVASTQSTTTTLYAFCGSDQVSCSVGTISNLPTGLTVTSDGKTPAPTLTITAQTTLTSGGSFNIPITIGDVTITKKFSYAIAYTGATGTSVTITNKSIQYAKSSSGTTIPSSWSDSVVAATDTEPYLWTKTVVTYSGNNGSTTSYSVGYKGKNGTNGTNGNDAISIEITSSAGIIFKNTAVSTTLTAHVYKGGSEVTGTSLSALGTIKWYKDGGATAVATGATLTIGTSDVTNSATYVAQLEG